MGAPDFDLTEAACRGHANDLFVPTGERGEPVRRQVAAAKAICARCPVAAACLAWAFEVGDDWGILGGKTRDERRAIRHRRAEQAAAADAGTCGRPGCGNPLPPHDTGRRWLYCTEYCRRAAQRLRLRERVSA
jgi:WhiB family redox-sensing transcriptional regulator